MNPNHLETLRSLWNGKTHVHKTSQFYNLEGFKAGANSLKKPEMEEMGDVRGKSLLHLQCHFGQDTLSWARLGAEVTGVDLSDEAIKLARELSAELDIPASFIQGNVLELDQLIDRRYDIVFTSYGTICWLPDLTLWARNIVQALKPGGYFYMIEHHPLLDAMDDDFQGFVQSFEYNPDPVATQETGSYTDGGEDFSHLSLWWKHPLSEVITVLAQAGLRIEYVHEFPYMTWGWNKAFVQGEDGFFRWRENKDTIPLMFSIKAWRDK
ncbi:MAG: class I SAM-dependent methyltransferase [Bacteroidia bacterium]|nr:class I SAM-dependent methyltransferase [Bacteroidia bacterium]